MDAVEEIRHRLPVEEVVGQYVQLKQSGRNFKGLCPFHQEKTPSFIVSPDKGLAYCFGCRKGGDIFAFVQEVENVDFPEALRILGEKAGVEVRKQTFSKETKQKKERRLDLLDAALQFFQDRLKKNTKALEYLSSRGYGEAEIKQLGLGFAPDSFHELTEALKKDYKPKEMLDVGLAAQKEVGDSNVYDRFRNRIIFPIHNPQGRLVAFGGRTLSTDPGAAKYLNSPESELYHKGQTLYCFHLAKKAIRDQDQAIVVEGYFDALSAHLHGFPQTVASLGTALTEDQIKLMGRFTKNLLFAFDADLSGQEAASRSIEIAQRLGFNVSVIRIPSGKDPDECLRNEPEEWQKAVSEALKAMDYEFEKAFAQEDSSSLEGKKAIVEQLIPIIQRAPSTIEQEHYLKKLSFDLGVSLKNLMKDAQRVARSIRKSPSPQAPEAPEQETEISYSRTDYLLGMLAQHPELVKVSEELIKPEFFAFEEQKNLYNSLAAHYNQREVKENPLSPEERTQHLQLLELYAEEMTASFGPEEREQEARDLCLGLRREYRKRRLQGIRFQLAQQNAPDATELMSEYQRLIADQF